LRTAVLSLFLASFFILSFSDESRPWDFIKKQLLPDDIAERPPEVYTNEDFDDVIFTRENFYNKSAGTRQYRQTISVPQKSMNFEALNPADEEPIPEIKVIEKDGRAVTVISIKKDSGK